MNELKDILESVEKTHFSQNDFEAISRSEVDLDNCQITKLGLLLSLPTPLPGQQIKVTKVPGSSEIYFALTSTGHTITVIGKMVISTFDKRGFCVIMYDLSNITPHLLYQKMNLTL